MNLVSTVRFESTTVELCVKHESPTAWRWCVCLLNAAPLVKGTSNNQVAAKFEAQRAFEERLKRAGLKRSASDPYDWKAKSSR